MAASFDLDILAYDKVVYSGRVSSLIVPAKTGYLGVLANHAPLMALLKPGKATIKDELSKPKDIQLENNGILEVVKNKATIILYSEKKL